MRNKVTKQLVVTIMLIFILWAAMLIVFFRSFYKNSVSNIKELGVSNMNSQASMVENYMNKGGNVLWFAVGSVEYMLQNGADSSEIEGYLISETADMQQQFDANFTGIYGYIDGNYIDGAGWIPPADYVPTERSWYKEGLKAGGEMVLSAPYVDAQTGEIVVSYCQMLSDGKSVLALDIVLNEIQNITEDISMGGLGYGFIVDDEGLVIAHSDPLEIGKDYSDYDEWPDMIRGINESEGEGFEMTAGGYHSTVFAERIATDWLVVIAVRNKDLYHSLRMQLMTGVLLSLIVFSVILVFSIFSAREIVRAEESEKESLDRLKLLNINIISTLASTIDAKDRYTSGHSQRVADYAVKIAKRMGKPEEYQKLVYSAGLLHDVGKISVPKEVINKPGKLTDEEFDQIRIHPVSGYHILSGIHDDVRIGYGAKYHHERYDGGGYPNGLEGDNIPEIARIIAVADAYDAMASDRSYRKALPQDIVRREIKNGSGSQFDPAIAEIMLGIIDEDKAYDLRQKQGMIHNILVIDDERMTLMHVKHILTDMEGIRVFEATAEQEIYPILEKNTISLILLDLVMPDGDGIDLYERICPEHDIPVILMTGDRSGGTLSRIRSHHIDDYLTKPLNATITREAVHGILNRFVGAESD